PNAASLAPPKTMKVTPKPKARQSMIERTAKNGSNVDGGCRAPGGFGQMAKVVKKATADTASVTAAAEYLLAISIASLQRRLAGAQQGAGPGIDWIVRPAGGELRAQVLVAGEAAHCFTVQAETRLGAQHSVDDSGEHLPLEASQGGVGPQVEMLIELLSCLRNLGVDGHEPQRTAHAPPGLPRVLHGR